MKHLVSLELDPTALSEFERLPSQASDLNYLVHAALTSLFETDAPKPFHIREPNVVAVVGYSQVPAETLLDRASFADPEVFRLLRPGKLLSRPFPQLPKDKVVRFLAHIQPTVRDRRPNGPRDCDVFDSPYWNPEGELDREGAYEKWLSQAFERDGAEPLEILVRSFSMAEHQRRKGRRMQWVRQPEIQVEGHLRVKDPDRFTALLAGVGRSRAFGCGMLRLGPPIRA